MRRLLSALATLLLVIVGALAVPSPAVADSDSEIPNCDLTGPVGMGDTGYGVWASAWLYVSPSACEDINVGAWSTGGMTVRVHFCSESSGCWVNSWKGVCDICRVAAATNVLDGTTFRVETQQYEVLNIWT